VKEVKFFKLFSCTSNTESLLLVGSSSSWYPTAQAVGLVTVFQVAQCYQKCFYYWPHPLRTSSCWRQPILVCLTCLPGVPDQPLLLLCFICCLQKMFLRSLPFHLTASSENQKKSTATEVEACDIYIFFSCSQLVISH